MLAIRLGVFWLISLISTSPVAAAKVKGEGEIVLDLRASQDEYVVREPIKLVVTLCNNSKEEIRTPGIAELAEEMEYIHYLEITTPRGEKQCRRYQFMYYSEAVLPGYVGEPLSPGDYRELYLYPNVTWEIDCVTQERVNSLSVTFPDPGEYRMRAYYVVPSIYRKLWKREGGLASNEIVLQVRRPNSEENEILDAVWGKSLDNLMWGDDFGCCIRRDELSLRHVIKKYPNNPLIKYALFELARSLSLRYNGSGEMMEALKIFGSLETQYPAFRYEEVRLHMGRTYRVLNQDVKALNSFAEALEYNPGLVDNYYFMAAKIYTETGSHEAIGRYKRDRAKGIIISPKKPKEEPNLAK
jgi:hypothetical protein